MRTARISLLITILLFITISGAGFCQEQSPPPQVWILKGDGEVSVLSAPTLTPTITPTPTLTPTPTPTPTPLPEIVISLPGGVTLEMIQIPAGSFMMGSPDNEQDRWSVEGPQHQVDIGYDFYLGKYEVTKAQWQAVMGTTPWSRQRYVSDDPKSPAVYVSWNDINGSGGFIEKINALGQGTFRLPSEAEWEYACRVVTMTRFYWGDDPNYTLIGDYAWYGSNAWSTNERYAHIVGQKLPNAWGVYDMSGNVWEWCQDTWHDSYNGAPTDGSAWEWPSSSYRVLRGGDWENFPRDCRSARRGDGFSGHRHAYGFRLVRTP